MKIYNTHINSIEICSLGASIKANQLFIEQAFGMDHQI